MTIEAHKRIPTFHSRLARKWLYRRYGLPNVVPHFGQSPFRECRILFVDDQNDGRPIAFWEKGNCYESKPKNL